MPADTTLRVLVTGGLGYIGRAVTARLAAAGHQVTVLTRRRPGDVPDAPEGTALVSGELTDTRRLTEVVTEGGFDAVCHLAARTRVRESFEQPLRYWDVNVNGTLCLLRALAAGSERSGRPARLVFASTGSVYGHTDGTPVTENHPTAPTSPYGASKLAAERLIGDQARTGQLGAVTLRVFSAAGSVGGRPDPDDTRILPKALAVAAGRYPHVTVNGDGSAVRDLTHLADLAEAWLRALAAARPGSHEVFNAGAGRGVSIREVIATVEEVTGRPVPVVHRPAAEEAKALLADATLAARQLGWTPARSSIHRIVTDAWTALTGQPADPRPGAR